MEPDIPDSVFLTSVQQRKSRESKLSSSAKKLAKELEIDDPGPLFEAMEFIWSRYSMNLHGDSGIENASLVRDDLQQLAARADELAATILRLGQGSVEVLNLPGAAQELWLEAEIASLPSRDPFGPACETSDRSVERGGQWIIRLRALAELAREKQRWVGAQTRKGGNKTLAPTIRKATSEDILAEDCIRFVLPYGKATQATALRMMQAIRGVEQSTSGGRTPIASATTEACRAAIRKAYQRVVQTQGE
ncbi:MAG TPA: hypothetical protein VGK03_11040 [Geothrix sp.]|jgi:hypothetical protein